MAKAARISGVELDEKGIGEMLRTNPEVDAAVRKEAEAIASRARANAPVDTGAYRDSIRVSRTTAAGAGHTALRFGGEDRIAYVVEATAPHAGIVEARTGNLSRARR